MFFKSNYLAMGCLCSRYLLRVIKMQDLTILLLTILCRFSKLLEGNIFFKFWPVIRGHIKKFYLRTGGGRGGCYAVLNIVLWGAVLYTLVPVLGEVTRTLVIRGVWSCDKTLLKWLFSTFHTDFDRRKNDSLNSDIACLLLFNCK